MADAIDLTTSQPKQSRKGWEIVSVRGTGSMALVFCKCLKVFKAIIREHNTANETQRLKVNNKSNRLNRILQNSQKQISVKD